MGEVNKIILGMCMGAGLIVCLSNTNPIQQAPDQGKANDTYNVLEIDEYIEILYDDRTKTRYIVGKAGGVCQISRDNMYY